MRFAWAAKAIPAKVHEQMLMMSVAAGKSLCVRALRKPVALLRQSAPKAPPNPTATSRRGLIVCLPHLRGRNPPQLGYPRNPCPTPARRRFGLGLLPYRLPASPLFGVWHVPDEWLRGAARCAQGGEHRGRDKRRVLQARQETSSRASLRYRLSTGRPHLPAEKRGTRSRTLILW